MESTDNMPVKWTTNKPLDANETLWFKDYIDSAEESGHIYSMANDIGNVYIWILFAIGVPGNLLALITILTLRNINSITLLIALLAAFDGSALISKLIGHQLSRNQVTIGTSLCGLQFLAIFLSTTANWILMLICIERYKTVCHPKNKMWLFTKKGTIVVVSVLILVFLVFFGTISGVMRVYIDGANMCGVYEEYIWFWRSVWYWINVSLYLFIPFLVIAPLTCLAVSKLYKRSRDTETRDHSQVSEPSTERSEAEQRVDKELTIMLILAAVFFLVLSLPGAIYYLTFSESSDRVVRARWYLFQQIQFVCVDSTHAINFFLYFLSAKMLRNHLYKLLMCKKCRG